MNPTLFRFAVLLVFPVCLFGQQEDPVTQFWNTYQYSNPAVSGLFNRIDAAGLYRGRSNYLDSPDNIYAGGSARIDALHGGVGASYQRYQNGWNTFQTVTASYAFHFNLAPGRKLSVGVAGGWKQANIGEDNGYLIPVYFRDNNFIGNIGVTYADSSWRAGISCTNLNQPIFRPGHTSGYSYTLSQHLWAFAEHDFHLGSKWMLTPRVSALTDFNDLTFSVSLMAKLNNHFWFGANYMYDYSAGLMVGYDFYGKFRIGYSYDFITQQSPYSDDGVHELVLAFMLK